MSLARQATFQLNGYLEDKNFSNASDLDFRIFSLDGIFRWQFSGSSVGFGPGVQRIAIAGKQFRDRQAIQADWTRSNAEAGYTTIVLDYGRNAHGNDFREMDSRSGILLVRRQFLRPLGFLDEFAVEGGVGREGNARGQRDLSNDLYYVRMSTEWQLVATKWSIGMMLQHSQFDASSLDGIPSRSDRFLVVDLSCEYPLSEDVTVRLDVSRSNNDSNSVLYESRFKGTTLSLQIGF